MTRAERRKGKKDGAADQQDEVAESMPNGDSAGPVDRRSGRQEKRAVAGDHAGADPQSSKLDITSITCAAFKCHHGKHVKAEPQGDVRATSAVVGDSEKFKLTHHEDGTVSLQSHHGAYVSIEANGDLRATRSTIGASEKLEMISHDDGTVSLRGIRGYVAADRGVLRANRAKIGAWEKFQVKVRATKPAKNGNEAPECPPPCGVSDVPIFDACCELEAVLAAEEQYARTHSDRTAKAFEKRVQSRRASGLELSLGHFCAEHAYPSAFRGCVSAWDATAVLTAAEAEDGQEGSHARRAWAAILAQAEQGAAGPRVHAAFGIPAASAAEADAPALERLGQLCRLPCCVAVGPVGLDFQAVPEAGPPRPEHVGLSLAAFEAEFGAPPRGAYQPARDPVCVEWLAAAPGLQVENWALKHGDRRLAEFEAARADYTRRRLDAQVAVAEAQVRLAKDLGLPLIVQLPPEDEAERRIAEILVAGLGGEGCEHPVLLSAFRGRPKCAGALLRHFPNLAVGFSGLLTHAKLQKPLGEVAFDTPLGRLVLESLGPRFPPAVAGVGDARGSFSHPAHVAAVADALAQVKAVSADEVLRAAWANTKRLFRLPEGLAAGADAGAGAGSSA